MRGSALIKGYCHVKVRFIILSSAPLCSHQQSHMTVLWFQRLIVNIVLSCHVLRLSSYSQTSIASEEEIKYARLTPADVILVLKHKWISGFWLPATATPDCLESGPSLHVLQQFYNPRRPENIKCFHGTASKETKCPLLPHGGKKDINRGWFCFADFKWEPEFASVLVDGGEREEFVCTALGVQFKKEGLREFYQ